MVLVANILLFIIVLVMCGWLWDYVGKLEERDRDVTMREQSIREAEERLMSTPNAVVLNGYKPGDTVTLVLLPDGKTWRKDLG